MKKKTIRDIDVRGKRVLLRVDYNVQVEDGQVVDDVRLRESLPTIRALRDAGACIIFSHRPKFNQPRHSKFDWYVNDNHST